MKVEAQKILKGTLIEELDKQHGGRYTARIITRSESVPGLGSARSIEWDSLTNDSKTYESKEEALAAGEEKAKELKNT